MGIHVVGSSPFSFRVILHRFAIHEGDEGRNVLLLLFGRVGHISYTDLEILLTGIFSLSRNLLRTKPSRKDTV